MGTWKLNEAKSKLQSGHGQEHDGRLLAEGGQNKNDRGWRGQGRETDARRLGRQMGWKSLPVERKYGLGPAAYKVVNDRTNDITTWKNGKLVWSGKITVAKDGKSRTVTINGTDANGKKFKCKAVYDKA